MNKISNFCLRSGPLRVYPETVHDVENQLNNVAKRARDNHDNLLPWYKFASFRCLLDSLALMAFLLDSVIPLYRSFVRLLISYMFDTFAHIIVASVLCIFLFITYKMLIAYIGLGIICPELADRCKTRVCAFWSVVTTILQSYFFGAALTSQVHQLIVACLALQLMWAIMELGNRYFQNRILTKAIKIFEPFINCISIATFLWSGLV